MFLAVCKHPAILERTVFRCEPPEPIVTVPPIGGFFHASVVRTVQKVTNVKSVLSEHPLYLAAIRRPCESQHQEDSRLERREIFRRDSPIRRWPRRCGSGVAVV